MKIIVPLRPKNVAELQTLLPQLDKRVDIVELWLDTLCQELITSPSLITQTKSLLDEYRQKLGVQYLGVCKTPAEQGKFGGSAAQRVQILQYFLQLGGDWIDLDVTQNSAELIATIQPDKLWLSYHDFKTLPNELESTLGTMRTYNPVVYKFAVTPQTEADLERFIKFAKDLAETAVFTTMGTFGSAGREQLKPYTWGAFYALSSEHVTATGQPQLGDLPSEV